MYQVSTYAPLALSKKYFETIDECKKHVIECIRVTNKFRAKTLQKNLNEGNILEGLRLIKIRDEDVNELLPLFGPIKEISLENLTTIE